MSKQGKTYNIDKWDNNIYNWKDKYVDFNTEPGIITMGDTKAPNYGDMVKNEWKLGYDGWVYIGEEETKLPSYKPKGYDCECGHEASGSQGRHSRWCIKFRTEFGGDY